MEKGLVTRVKGFVKSIPAYWEAPPEGRHISYKEFAAYSFGGIGVNTINSLMGYIGLSSTCLLIGSAYEIEPVHLALMMIFVNIVNLAKTPFVSMLIDNTNTKYGKFRPYLLLAGVPAAIFICLMAFVPVGIDYRVKCIIICGIYTLAMVFQSVFALAFTSLAQVLTPDGEERTGLLSISQFVYSLGPSIVNIVLPIFAGFFAGGMKGVTAYRVIFPVFSAIGIVLSVWTFKDTREKIVVPKSYVAKVKFFHGIKSLSGNRHFWLFYLYNILGSMKYGIGSILTWYCAYVLQSDATLGIMNAVIGTASVPGMLLAPMLAKKLGKKSCLIMFNLVRAVFTTLMLFTSDSPVLFIGSLYLATLAIGGDGVICASMTADIFDYQQWKTGQRLEGFITQFGGMLVTGVGLVTGLIVPSLQEYYGLHDDYTVLFDEAIRNPIFNVMIISTLVSTLLAIVPILFYNLTEKQQQQIAAELLERKTAEDGIEK